MADQQRPAGRRICRVHIENFRSIQRLDLTDLPQIGAIVGPNNGGKSNLLKAIRTVLDRDWVTVSSFSEEDVFGHDPERDILIEISFDPPIPYRHIQSAPEKEITTLSYKWCRYKIGPRKNQRRLEQSCLDAKGNTISVQRSAPQKGKPPEFERLTGIPQAVRDQVPAVFIGTDRQVDDQLPTRRGSMLRALLEDIEADLRAGGELVDVVQPDGTSLQVSRVEAFERLVGQALSILRTSSFVQLEEAIQRNALEQLGLDPVADRASLDLQFGHLSVTAFYRFLRIVVQEMGVVVDASELGGGFQNAIVLAILRAFEERRKHGAILLIEEPEMFLHPQMQRSLYRTLAKIGETNQVLYTTHSPHFLNVSDFWNVLRVTKLAGGTAVKRSDIAYDARFREKLLKELGPERGELFFGSRVLLVEGATETLSLPEYAGRLGIDYDRRGGTIISAAGKRLLLDLGRVVASLGVPVAILYDRSSSDLKGHQEEEESLNQEIEAFAAEDPARRAWQLDPDWEGNLRTQVGEEEYQRMCQLYPGHSKAIRARLIAADDSAPVPDPVPEVIDWLAGAAETSKPDA